MKIKNLKERENQFQNVVILVVIFIAISLLMWLWNRFDTLSCRYVINSDLFSNYGSFIGGTLGTAAAMIAIWLAYITYRSQKIDQEKERIENHFFEMLHVHQKNVDKLHTLDENIFEIYLDIIKTFATSIKKQNPTDSNLTTKDIVRYAYLYFFYGTEADLKSLGCGTNSDRLKKYFKGKQCKFDGVYHNLGIYFRHLYQTVQFINSKEVLSYDEKYAYIKIVRARLNITEQYLLFLNSLTVLGHEWEEEKNYGLITMYNLLANIPSDYKPILDELQFNSVYPDIHYEFSDNKSEERKVQEEEYRELSPGLD